MRFTSTSIANMKRLQEDALDALAYFEAPPSDTELAGGEYNALNEVITPPANVIEAAKATLRAKQVDNDAKAFGGLGLQITDGITLRVEANGEFEPRSGMTLRFPATSGQRFNVKSAKPVKQLGTAQIYVVIGGI